MDPINKNTYTDVRSRIKSQIYNRILKKPNPDSYEMVSSVSGTSKSLGGGISLPDRIKEFLGLGGQKNSETGANGPVKTSDSTSSAGASDVNNVSKESEINEGNEERSRVSLLPDSGNTGGQVQSERPEASKRDGKEGEERETFINLSTLAKFIGVDRKKLQRTILQYSMVYGEGFYNVESNSYQIPIKSASVIVLGKKMVERGNSRSYREAFRDIKDKSDGELKKELEQIEESIKSYIRESRVEIETKEEVPTREDEKEAFGVVGALAEALIEASSSITSRINEIENSILDFHYTFLKIKQEVESVKGELERIEKMVTEYLMKKQE